MCREIEEAEKAAIAKAASEEKAARKKAAREQAAREKKEAERLVTLQRQCVPATSLAACRRHLSIVAHMCP